MRISDWSSDVCSSDLRVRSRPDRQPAAFGHCVSLEWRDVYCAAQGHRRSERSEDCRENSSADRTTALFRQWQRDRKSVVKGKSVSGRVDLGGRRTLKKKKTG